MMPKIERIDHVVMNTRDVENTASWYVKVLGFKREPIGPQQRVSLRFGLQKFNLRPTGDAAWGTCPVEEPGALDLCFMTKGPLTEVIRHLGECGVEIVHGPFSQIGALGEMTSVYCRDPDDNLIEIASYEGRPYAG
jgi:catechol 2,3-dioxygenase-like lactoylglutathione lyase family enzyme